MAIYHLTVNVISRARGQSVIAVAAYRAGAALRDERYGTSHNYTSKHGAAEYCDIMAPADAPPWVSDREVLWNRVEAAELRKDSQLARVIEVGLPIELTARECVALVRDYIAGEFVSKGMVADFAIRRDNPHNPHAHILLTLRALTPTGFGPKQRQWNGKSNLYGWRAAWAERANEHLARAGHAVRIDHRTLEAQQIELAPGRRVGFGRSRDDAGSLPEHLADRLDEQRRIARENGEAIIEDPAVVLRAITHQWPSFTLADLAQFLKSRTDASQFDAAYLAVTTSGDLVVLPPDGSGGDRFTSRDMIEAARSLRQRVISMAGRRGHALSLRSSDGSPSSSAEPLPPPAPPAPSPLPLNPMPCVDEQRRVLDYLTAEGDAKAIAVMADGARDALLAAARLAWQASGLRVIGAASSRAAAEHLQAAAGISSQPLAAYEDGWQRGLELLAQDHVLLVDGAEMLGLRQLERIVGVADKARAKVVLIGNAAQLQAMRIESAFQSVLREIGLPDPQCAAS